MKNNYKFSPEEVISMINENLAVSGNTKVLIKYKNDDAWYNIFIHYENIPINSIHVSIHKRGNIFKLTKFKADLEIDNDKEYLDYMDFTYDDLENVLSDIRYRIEEYVINEC